MKTYLSLFLGAFAVVMFAAGCAHDSGGTPPPAAVPPGATPVPGSPCPVGQSLNTSNQCVNNAQVGGSGVPLNIVSTAELDRMFFMSNPQNPQNVQIQINTGSAAGAVVISYVDGTGMHQASFGTVHPYSGVSDSSYNMWYNDQQTGKQVWKGFFQDAYGAVILVIDQTTALGDGTPGDIVGGSVWFQNFGQTGAVQGPDKMCWQITMGPFDCRSWLFGYDSNNMVVMPAMALYPNNKGPDQPMSYEKLGTFSGLHRAAAGI